MSRRIFSINERYISFHCLSFYENYDVIDCWQILPQDRPTFSQLYDQINNIIETNYANNELNNMEPSEETYSSLQQDWRKEIQDIFAELKTKEQVKKMLNKFSQIQSFSFSGNS
jgi:hypothetical protein